jgi:HlyD family secretion protein
MDHFADIRDTAQPASRPTVQAGPARRWRVPARAWVAGAVATVLVVGAVVGWLSLHTSTTIHYLTAPVTRGTVARTVTATGTVNPELTIIVGSYVSGVIKQLFCDYNTQVKAGQVCAKIDPRPYETKVSQAKANLAVARAQLERGKAEVAYRKINYERNRWLAERDSVARDAVDLAKNAYDQAQAQVDLDQATIEQREAELEAAEVDLGYTDIISPVDGTVVSRNVTQGQTVASSFQTPTLFLIATDLTRMQVDTNVSESDIGVIRQGDKATFTVDAFPRRVFQGTVSQVRQSPQTVQNVVTFDAVVSVDNEDLVLKPGMTASTRIVVDQREGVIRVPNQALRYAPPGVTGAANGARLWLLRDGQPVSVAVTIGLDDENFTEVAQGDLKPGDTVIVGENRGQVGGPASPSPRF